MVDYVYYTTNSNGDYVGYGSYSGSQLSNGNTGQFGSQLTFWSTSNQLVPGSTQVNWSIDPNNLSGTILAQGIYTGNVTIGGSDFGVIDIGGFWDGLGYSDTSDQTVNTQTVDYNNNIFCFLTGTHITTPTGEVLIEDLKIGDLVSTADGSVRKVLWIGQQKVSTVFGSPKNYPVEICISALGDNLPKRPLRVSPGHSLLVSGVFPIASALVNDVTVRQLTKEELPDTFTYYHIEVEDHALILAEGVPAETFLDASSRRQFSNWSEYVELYGEEEREVPRSDLHYKRILKFDNLSQELKETIGYPLSYDEMKVA